MHPANERRRYNVTSPLIGWVHTQNGSWANGHRHIGLSMRAHILMRQESVAPGHMSQGTPIENNMDAKQVLLKVSSMYVSFL